MLGGVSPWVLGGGVSVGAGGSLQVLGGGAWGGFCRCWGGPRQSVTVLEEGWGVSEDAGGPSRAPQDAGGGSLGVWEDP